MRDATLTVCPCLVLQVTGVSLSPGDDQLLVVHIEHNDLVICLFGQSKANRVTELMANLYLQIYQ